LLARVAAACGLALRRAGRDGGKAQVYLFHRHDPAAQARARCQDPVVPHLVGSRRRNQRNEAVDQLAALHRDVRGAVAPAGLQAKQKPAILAFLEPFIGQWWTRDVSTKPLEAAAIARGHRDGSVKAHASADWHAR
jgi:hypothetical protein